MTESDLQRNQELNLHENERNVAAENQNSSIGRIAYIVYFLFSQEVGPGIRVGNLKWDEPIQPREK